MSSATDALLAAAKAVLDEVAAMGTTSWTLRGLVVTVSSSKLSDLAITVHECESEDLQGPPEHPKK